MSKEKEQNTKKSFSAGDANFENCDCHNDDKINPHNHVHNCGCHDNEHHVHNQNCNNADHSHKDCGCHAGSKLEDKSKCTCGDDCDCHNEKSMSTESLIEALTKERDEYLDMAKRSMAEFANFKKRNEEAISVAMEAGAIKAITQILPSIDAFDKALNVATDEKTKEGLALIKADIERAFNALNVTEIDALNKPFDPSFHEAISTCEAKSAKEKDIVAEVFQKGFMYKDKVLRYAIVKVAK